MYFYEEPVYPYPQVLPETEYELPVEDQQQPEYTQEPSRPVLLVLLSRPKRLLPVHRRMSRWMDDSGTGASST
jgi:hypothetical protein